MSKSSNTDNNFSAEQLDAIRDTLGGFKKYNPKLVPICGSVNAVILFLQLEYLRDTFKKNYDVEEFWHTDKQLQEELGFGRKQLKNAKDQLVEHGLISYRVTDNMPPKTHYTVDVYKFMNDVSEMYQRSIPKCTFGTSRNVPLVHTKKNNKQDIYKKHNNNRASPVDKSPNNPPDASQQLSCGAVPMKLVSEQGNTTQLFLRLSEVPDLSQACIKTIIKTYEEYQILNALDACRKKDGIFHKSAAGYIVGYLKKTVSETLKHASKTKSGAAG